VPAPHRHQEYVRFLRKIDVSVPARFAVHLIVDNLPVTGIPSQLSTLNEPKACEKATLFPYAPLSQLWRK